MSNCSEISTLYNLDSEVKPSLDRLQKSMHAASQVLSSRSHCSRFASYKMLSPHCAQQFPSQKHCSFHSWNFQGAEAKSSFVVLKCHNLIIVLYALQDDRPLNFPEVFDPAMRKILNAVSLEKLRCTLGSGIHISLDSSSCAMLELTAPACHSCGLS